MANRYWLMKSEPDVYSIDDLARDGVTPWEGVRNYQARNLLRDEVRVGDGVLFYHSSTTPPGVAGLGEVVHESYPDRTALDPKSPYHDEKSTAAAPRWYAVDVRFVERFPAVVPLSVLYTTPGLEGMLVTKKGMRLSVQPVTDEEWRIVVALGRAAGPVSDTATEIPAARGKSRRAPAKAAAANAPAKAAAANAPAKAAAVNAPARPRSGGERATSRERATKVARSTRAPERKRPRARPR